MFPIKTVLGKYKLRPTKKLGQNFLISEEALQTIVDALDIKKDDVVLEIGAGIGNLSALIAAKAKTFYCIEKDKRFNKILKKVLEQFSDSTIIFTDILKFDLAAISQNKRIKIVGNLPFYITSPILKHLISQREYIDTILITVQKEVANRIIALPGNKDYGRLTCLLQFFTKPKLIDNFPKNLFYSIPIWLIFFWSPVSPWL